MRRVENEKRSVGRDEREVRIDRLRLAKVDTVSVAK